MGRRTTLPPFCVCNRATGSTTSGDSLCVVEVCYAGRRAEERDAAIRAAEGWLVQDRGDVPEVGVRSGLNLPFYPSQVYSLDSSVELQQMARKEGAARTAPPERPASTADS